MKGEARKANFPSQRHEMPPAGHEFHALGEPTANMGQTVSFPGALPYTGGMSPFRISLRRSFVADHFHDLPGFQEARHGHNWELEATVAFTDICPEPALERALDRALDAWVGQVDYTLLNDQAWLKGRNPTAEALAHWLLEFIRERGISVLETRIREKANYWAACRREAE